MDSVQLVITRQTSLAQEIITKNGLEKDVHIVVKNTPFHIQCSLQNDGPFIPNLNFNTVGIETGLIYDTDEMKSVDFVKLKPLECKTHINEAADQMTLELRLKVLTSQLEDMFFKVKLTAIDIRTKMPYPNVHVFSLPIKVISKPDQVRKRPTKKKRTLNDMIIESLTRLENQQKQQLTILQQLKGKSSTGVSPISDTSDMQLDADFSKLFANMGTQPAAPVTAKLDLPVNPVKKEPSSFDDAYLNFMKAFANLKPEERPMAVRRVTRTQNMGEAEILREFLDLVQGEVFQKELGQDVLAQGTPSLCELGQCECSPNECAHKAEFQRIDQYYNNQYNNNQYPNFFGTPIDDVPFL